MVWTVESQNKKNPGYAAYHQQVVGWHSCSFVEEFIGGRDPSEVVQDQLDAMDFSREDCQMKLDAKGRCCGRKPVIYKRPPSRFCCRCNRSYDYEENQQIANWAWKQLADGSWEYQVGKASRERG